jgi:flagellar basal body-associated protein FliL
MKKKILIISLICVFIIGCFVVFSITNKKYNLFNKNKTNVSLDSVKLETIELAVDTFNIVDSLSLVVVDSNEITKSVKNKKEVNKVDYWTKKKQIIILKVISFLKPSIL